MGSIQNPIGGAPRDPYESYRVEAIEKDKQAKEEQNRSPNEPPKGPSALIAYLLTLLQKLFELFVESPEKKISFASGTEIRSNLVQLKAALETLKIEDRSQDTGFLNHLSNLWQHVLEDALRFQQSTLLSNRFKAFVKQIQTYPENQAHTLGYYLSEYAGQKWLPFPYMEMIQKIHLQYRDNPEDSPLDRWISQIDELALLLKPQE